MTPQNATDLTRPQLAALVSLASGSTVTDAAKAAGVDRGTVHRWLADDAAFVAENNRGKLEALEAIRAELRLAAAEAVATIRRILRGGDIRIPAAVQLKAALSVLAMVGEHVPPPMGPTDPEDAEIVIRSRESDRELAALIS